jgi:hypothetical protein
MPHPIEFKDNVRVHLPVWDLEIAGIYGTHLKGHLAIRIIDTLGNGSKESTRE